MTTQFLSKSDRIDKNTIPLDRNGCIAGPGTYVLPCSLKYDKPAFTPFATSGSRSKMDKLDTDIPAPGTYNIQTQIISKGTVAATAFKSKTDRFEVKIGKIIAKVEHPLEKELNSKLEIENEHKKHTSSREKLQTSNNIERRGMHPGMEILRNIVHTAPPSVPTRLQSFGYEENEETGRMSLNKPFGIITGEKEDKIGPGQYNINRQIHSNKAVDFGKGSLRQLDNANTDTMGPGNYNLYSNFDLAQIGKERTNPDKENEFYRKMFLSQTKQKSSTFASKTVRETFPDHSVGPGPGNYLLPTAIKLQKIYQEVPIGGEAPRFESVERARRDAGPSPWTYNPLTSDFDKDKIHILKQKKMRSRSGWAQNISFAATEVRPFNNERAYTSDAAPPGAYDPKLNMSDFIPTQNPRSGPFGNCTERFKTTGTKSVYPPNKDEVISEELTREYNEQNPASRVESPSSRFRNRRRGFAQSVFGSAPTLDRTKEKPPDGPPPNNYDTAPSWDKGTSKMKPAMLETMSKFQRELIQRKNAAKAMAPGPGAYLLPSSVKVVKTNNTGVGMGTSVREGPVMRYQQDLPAPGAYNLATTLEKKSYNVYLAENF